jgi:PAS domain S-box-containing protein
MKGKTESKEILQFAYNLNLSTDLKMILNKIVEKESLSIISTKHSTIYFLDKDKKYLVPKATLDQKYRKQSMQELIPVESSLSGEVIKAKKGMIFNDAAQKPNAFHIPGTSNNKSENLIVVPLIIENNVFGTINLYRDDIPYSVQELDLANIFGMYASIAIHNALINQQLNFEMQERKSSDEKFRTYFNDSLVGTFISTPRGEIIDCNETYVTLMKYPDKKTALSASAYSVYKDRRSRDEKISVLKEHEKLLQFEEEIVRYDGKIISVLSNVWGEYNEKGNLLYIQGFVHDITDSKRAEKELIEKNEKLELFAKIFNNLNECITVTNEDHKIFYVNKAFQKLYGYKENEYLNKAVDFLRMCNDVKLLSDIKSGTNSGGWKGEILNRKKDGTIFPIELSTTPIYNKDNQIIARIGIVRDITEKKKSDKELDDYKNKLEKLVEERTKKLEKVNTELDNNIKLFVGREMKLVEYQNRINELERELKKYDKSTF